jgi:hypothetical protein
MRAGELWVSPRESKKSWDSNRLNIQKYKTIFIEIDGIFSNPVPPGAARFSPEAC